MSSYTCITCRVAFLDADIQRAHYKTDWHRYNLKRKVADMPPVTAENFQERVLAQRAAVEEQQKGTATHCVSCGKKFSNCNAYENHLKSRKHLEVEKRALQAASKEVERLNEKNLEKGGGTESMDKDAMNMAIQQALASKRRPTPSSARSAASQPAGSSQQPQQPNRQKADKPPRLQWFEQQAQKLAEQQPEEEEMEDAEEDEEWEEIGSSEEEELEIGSEDKVAEGMAAGVPLPGAIPVTDCLFCSHHSSCLMKNVAHMTRVHSFLIPDIEYLVDLKGLINYLGEKVGVGKICLWCNEKGRSFYSTEAVQAHMTDKSHCKLFTEGDTALEFADFYDFRSSYPDHKDGEDVEMLDDELPNESILEYDEETLELVLPSGARVGHRSLMKYYKQRFGTRRAVVLAKTQRAVGKVLQQYKALGWTSEMAKETTFKKERDMQYVQRMKSRWMLRTGVSNNATKQMHFRAQVRF
ncbi:cytoplasmic 60S subunit biogenesis factor ZNF622 [Latimeria chalumnae]|uniref:cytoplasmic 60S subunit biogenesis factor ZNF622 n=1 Tax=Latimeria chalumnae TaxID=7897 RepID=UPI00313D5017